eukprot:2758067-Rhodomonas_salina.2
MNERGEGDGQLVDGQDCAAAAVAAGGCVDVDFSVEVASEAAAEVCSLTSHSVADARLRARALSLSHTHLWMLTQAACLSDSATSRAITLARLTRWQCCAAQSLLSSEKLSLASLNTALAAENVESVSAIVSEATASAPADAKSGAVRASVAAAGLSLLAGGLALLLPRCA